MASKQLSQRQIFEMAEQVILGQKNLRDFSSLPDDDQAKIKTIVDRGVKALAESHRKGAYVKKQLHYRKTRPRASGQEFFVADRRPENPFVTLMKSVPFTPYPFDQLLDLSEPEFRRLMEEVNRQFSLADWASLFDWLPDREANMVAAALSPRLAEDIGHETERQRELEEGERVDPASVLAKYSITTILFLRDKAEASDAVEEHLTQYIDGLRGELVDYCKTLPRKLGLVKTLTSFDSDQWMRLAGMTPRDHLALMGESLPKEIFQKLFDPLPNQQKEEVMSFKERKEEERGARLESYGDVITTLKRWTSVVDKIAAEKVSSN